MLTSDDPQPGVIHGINMPPMSQNDEYLARLSMDMTALNITHRDTDNSLAKTFTDQSVLYSVAQEKNWFDEMVESSSSNETTGTFLYDSINSQSNEKLNYVISHDKSDVPPNDMGFSSINLPLLDYYPSYNVESDKMTDMGLNNTHTEPSLSLNSSFGQSRLNNSHYYTQPTESLSQLDMTLKHTSHKKSLYELGENYVFLKILATQLVSGTIIGRGGKGLNWFRRKSKVDDILISMPWELYPKTEYRTMLLKGTLKSVIKSMCIISDLMNSRYTLMADSTMMVIVVLPDVFLSAINEIQRTTNPNMLSITMFRDQNARHQEVVAVIKGVKSKVKDLVAAIATSISETIDQEKYCFVTYNGDDHGARAQESPNDIRRHRNQRFQTPFHKTQESYDVDILIQQIENAVDKGNVATLSKISALVKHKPELLSRHLEVNVSLPRPLTEDVVSLASVLKCQISQAPDGDGALVTLNGQFASVFATLLVIFTKYPI